MYGAHQGPGGGGGGATWGAAAAGAAFTARRAMGQPCPTHVRISAPLGPKPLAMPWDYSCYPPGRVHRACGAALLCSAAAARADGRARPRHRAPPGAHHPARACAGAPRIHAPPTHLRLRSGPRSDSSAHAPARMVSAHLSHAFQFIPACAAAAAPGQTRGRTWARRRRTALQGGARAGRGCGHGRGGRPAPLGCARVCGAPRCTPSSAPLPLACARTARVLQGVEQPAYPHQGLGALLLQRPRRDDDAPRAALAQRRHALGWGGGCARAHRLAGTLRLPARSQARLTPPSHPSALIHSTLNPLRRTSSPRMARSHASITSRSPSCGGGGGE